MIDRQPLVRCNLEDILWRGSETMFDSEACDPWRRMQEISIMTRLFFGRLGRLQALCQVRR